MQIKMHFHSMYTTCSLIMSLEINLERELQHNKLLFMIYFAQEVSSERCHQISPTAGPVHDTPSLSCHSQWSNNGYQASLYHCGRTDPLSSTGHLHVDAC